jgi:excinuclease UvrABC nuclease subunit
VTRKKILKHFGSIQKLSETPKQEILEILWKSVTENLENHGLI